MAIDKFDNKKLNPNDHKKEDNVANIIRNGGIILTALGFIVKGAINIFQNKKDHKS